MEEKICAADDCENVFVPKREWQKYCSYRCKNRQTNRKYRQEHSEELKARNRKWKQEHAEQVSVYSRKRAEQVNTTSRKWYQEHAEQVSVYGRKYRQEHPERRKVRDHNRRARIKGNGGSYTVEELNDLFEQQEGLCFYCGRLLFESFEVPFHIDHKIPISRGGSNNISNIVLSCAECNLRKGTNTHDEFLSISSREK